MGKLCRFQAWRGILPSSSATGLQVCASERVFRQTQNRWAEKRHKHRYRQTGCSLYFTSPEVTNLKKMLVVCVSTQPRSQNTDLSSNWTEGEGRECVQGGWGEGAGGVMWPFPSVWVSGEDGFLWTCSQKSHRVSLCLHVSSDSDPGAERTRAWTLKELKHHNGDRLVTVFCRQ